MSEFLRIYKCDDDVYIAEMRFPSDFQKFKDINWSLDGAYRRRERVAEKLDEAEVKGYVRATLDDGMKHFVSQSVMSSMKFVFPGMEEIGDGQGGNLPRITMDTGMHRQLKSP